ncbi:hypothetical protein PORCRE_2047 [Porphyromonas crevioricanis JCM 15906]|uniref:Uncharacterized protein n=1 Tax=Porphyromonas crevioricanis JCM 15906 TaxID=1305617 RepID=T1DU75_9PORP|nr:hypothetical protein PORCRE_2047 [Porphyromonas crevioricanis JCM 15906]GAD06713.1 hypothetical protein PORCAN_312 [Porphyromonas crevioricanis JCM 13913]
MDHNSRLLYRQKMGSPTLKADDPNIITLTLELLKQSF